MNLPQVYMCSPSWTHLPPPSPYHPSGSSQCSSPKHPVSCIKPRLWWFSWKEYFVVLKLLKQFSHTTAMAGFPESSVSKCNSGDPSSIPGSGSSQVEGTGYPLQYSWASLVAQLVESTWNVGNLVLTPGLGRSPGEGKGCPLQYSALENSMNCIVHGVTKSWTWLSDFHFIFTAMAVLMTSHTIIYSHLSVSGPLFEVGLVICVFCVDHNKLWKILKEMGIPDHLTCFLRNLYAGHKATVRTGHGTDWFQTGKRVRQGCILYPCFLTYMQSTSWETLGWRKHKLESRLLGEISITSDMQMAPPLWQKAKKK